MPGSTFKIITTGIGLQNGVARPPDARSPTRARGCRRRPTTRSRTSRARRAVATWPRSSPAAATSRSPRSAVELGPGADGRRRRRVGHRRERCPIDLPRPAASTFGDTRDFDENLPLLAIARLRSGNEVQMVPLHMAMVAATVANGGQMMKPYVVDATLDHDGRLLDQTEPEVWKTPISPETRGTLNDADAGRGHQRHGELLHRPRQRHPGRGEDRHRPAQRGRASRNGRTPGSSPSPRPTTRSTPSP